MAAPGDEMKKRQKKDASLKMGQREKDMVKDICNVDLRGKVRMMAGLSQELVRRGKDYFFLAAVISGDSFVFCSAELGGGGMKSALQEMVIELAIINNADCLVTASLGWLGPPDSTLRPSMNPARQEVIMVGAKDNFEHLGAWQDIQRHDNEVTFGDFEIYSAKQSWLDGYRGFDEAIPTC
jgi:hypothetical protein